MIRNRYVNPKKYLNFLIIKCEIMYIQYIVYLNIHIYMSL